MRVVVWSPNFAERLHSRLATSVITGALSQGILVVSGVVIARSLGPENRGYFALVTLVPMVIAEVGNLGLPTAMTYEIARGVDARQVTRKLRPVFMTQVACASVLTAAILYAITRGDPRSVATAALIAVAAVPATLTLRYSLALLQGLQRFTAFNLLRVAPATLNSAVLFLLWMFHSATLVPITLAYTLTTIAAACVALSVARRAGNAESRLGPEPARLSTLIRFGVTGFLGVSSPLETFRLDQATVGLFLTAQGLGLYVIAISVTNLPRFVAQSVGMVAYPDIAAAPRSEARRRTFRFMGIAAVTSGLTVLGLEIAAGRLIPFFFGSTYADAVLPARILLVSALLLGVRRVLGDCARGAGRPVVGSAAEAASWVALIPALAFLAPTHGIVGVAWAVFAASCVSAVTAVVFAFAPRARLDWTRVVSYAAPVCLAVAAGLALGEFVTLSVDVVTVAAMVASAVGIAMLLAQPGLDRRLRSTQPDDRCGCDARCGFRGATRLRTWRRSLLLSWARHPIGGAARGRHLCCWNLGVCSWIPRDVSARRSALLGSTAREAL